MGLYQTKFWFRNSFGRLTKYFIKVNPDVLSYLAVLVSAVTGVALFYSSGNADLLLISFVLIILRMILNTFDGMIAIAQGKKTMIGEVVNALPDRYSDIFVMLGIALCSDTNHIIGIVAVVSVLLVSYTGMLGKAMGVSWQHQGPVGKVDRLVVLLFVLIAQYLITINDIVLPGFMGSGTSIFNWLLIWYIIGSQLTIANRVRGLIEEIKISENSAEAEPETRKDPRGIIVYDSLTENTKKIAEAIASTTHFTVSHVDNTALDLSEYNILVIGSLNVRANVSKKMLNFVEKVNPPGKFALFITFGMPVWGQISTFNLVKMTVKKLTDKRSQVCGVFQCPGFHRKYKTYKGRPNFRDINHAKLFGLDLKKKL